MNAPWQWAAVTKMSLQTSVAPQRVSNVEGKSSMAERAKNRWEKSSEMTPLMMRDLLPSVGEWDADVLFVAVEA